MKRAMLTLAGICGMLTLADIAQAQFKFGNDSIGFDVDTLRDGRRIDPSHPWVWEVKPRNPTIQMYWYQIASCQGLPPKDEFRHIRWFIVNTVDFGMSVGSNGVPHGFIGYTLPGNDGHFSIYLSIVHASEKTLLQHEMTHVLLIISGYPLGHPPQFFLRCGLNYLG